MLICFSYVRLRFSSWRGNYRKRSTRESWFRKRPIRCQHVKPNTAFATLACFYFWQRVMFPSAGKYLVHCFKRCMAHAKCTIFMSWQLQTGLEANRILLRSVSPCMSSRQSKERKSSSKVRTVTERAHWERFLPSFSHSLNTCDSCSLLFSISIQYKIDFAFLSPESHPAFTSLCLRF